MNSKYQLKIVKSLSKVLINEVVHLRKYRILAKVSGIFGWFIASFVFLSALHSSNSNNIWYVVFGTVGGFLIGLSSYFHSSVQQWPIIRKFLDEKAIHEAANKEML